MFRPDGWINPHISLVSMKPINHEYEAYEAGADAILEGLFKLAKESPTGKFEIDSNKQQFRSRVFIHETYSEEE